MPSSSVPTGSYSGCLYRRCPPSSRRQNSYLRSRSRSRCMRGHYLRHAHGGSRTSCSVRSRYHMRGSNHSS